MTTNNTVTEKAARRKLNLLELAIDLGNVSEACRRIGYSREQFYEIKKNYQAFGTAGLLDKVRGPQNPHPSRAIEEHEKAVLNYCLEFPTHGQLRVSQQLLLRGIQIGVGAIRGIWQRYDMLLKHQRLLSIEQLQ
jgi:hypothetical protein